MERDETVDRERAHRLRTEPWVEQRQARRLRGERHPVDDFLFEYYPYSMSKLTTWHPGWGVTVQRDRRFLQQHRDYIQVGDGASVGLDGLLRRRERLELAAVLLQSTVQRAPQFNCFGMHEWAMVFRQQATDIRHADYPLRLDSAAIEQAVVEVGLRCTHLDAFRFFTADAMPRNAHQLTRATQAQFEQPGCVHAAMDLYKYAMWAGPYLPSELVADCFELARTARTLDMEASPYDLTGLGYQAIPMETAAGRAEYVARQRELSASAQQLRSRLLKSVQWLLDITAQAAPRCDDSLRASAAPAPAAPPAGR